MDCVHFCAYHPPMWVPIWVELLNKIKNFHSPHPINVAEKPVFNNKPAYDETYTPFFGHHNIHDFLIFNVTNNVTKSEGDYDIVLLEWKLYLYYQGVSRVADGLESIMERLGINRTHPDFPSIITMSVSQFHDKQMIINKYVAQCVSQPYCYCLPSLWCSLMIQRMTITFHHCCVHTLSPNLSILT